MDQNMGRIAQIQSSVVDVQFPEEGMPEIFEGLEVQVPDGKNVVLEVQRHLGSGLARAVAMDSTDGLMRGLPVGRMHRPITVPVGPETLGRVFNVVGEPVDNRGPVKTNLRYPIHRPAPSFEDQVTRVDVFETGLKVIDLIAPFTMQNLQHV